MIALSVPIHIGIDSAIARQQRVVDEAHVLPWKQDFE
jgi:hypothetical protein